MLNFKPASYSTVSPYLIVSGAAGTISFLEAAFSGVILRVIPGPGGRIMHAEVRIDDTVVMLVDAAPEWPPVPAHVHVYVADVDEVYERALRAGATPVQPPVKGQDENRRGAVKDAGGTTWWLATRVESFGPI